MKSSFAKRLSRLRREAGYNQRQVASDLGISQALLSHYENGAREPKLDFVIKACDYYSVSADYILGRSSDRGSVASEIRETLSGIIGELHNAKQTENILIDKLRKLAKDE